MSFCSLISRILAFTRTRVRMQLLILVHSTLSNSQFYKVGRCQSDSLTPWSSPAHYLTQECVAEVVQYVTYLCQSDLIGSFAAMRMTHMANHRRAVISTFSQHLRVPYTSVVECSATIRVLMYCVQSKTLFGDCHVRPSLPPPMFRHTVPRAAAQQDPLA